MNSALPSLHCRKNYYDGGYEMVSYDDFKEFMRIKAEEETGGRAKVSRVRKLNGVVLDGLTIMTTDSNISPAIYLNEFYDDFKNAPESDEEALEIIWNSIRAYYYRHLPIKGLDVNDFMSWDLAKNKLVPRLINTKKNMELLEDTVSIDLYDLSIIFVIKVGSDEFNGSIMVKKEHTDLWNVSAEEMYEIALENIADDWKITSMTEMLNELGSGLMDCDELGNMNIYVLSNKDGVYGASAMLNKDVFDNNKKTYGFDRIYIIPSSVHELLLIPADNQKLTVEYINMMIREVNMTTVGVTEILSDNVYVYDISKNKLVA